MPGRPGPGEGGGEVPRARGGIGHRAARRDRAGDDRTGYGWPAGPRRSEGLAAFRHASSASAAGSAGEGIRMTSRNWPKQFRGAASTFDWPAVAQLATEYAADLYAVPKLPDSVGQ